MEYDFISGFEYGVAIVRKDNKYGAILKNGAEFIPIEYTYLSTFKDGYANFILGWLSGKIDLSGFICVMDGSERVPLPKKYKWGTDFVNGYSVIYKDGLYGVINRKFDEIIPPRYDEVWIYPNQVVRVNSQSKYGLIDLTGKEIVPLKYDEIKFLSSGIAIVKLGESFGVINKNGKEVLPLSYFNIYPNIKIYRNYITVNQEAYDFQGNEMQISQEKDYSKTSLWSDRLNKYSQEIDGVTLYGIRKNNGEIIVPPRFAYIERFDHEEMAHVTFPDSFIRRYWLDSTEYEACYINRQGILHLKVTEKVYVENENGILREEGEKHHYVPIPSCLIEDKNRLFETFYWTSNYWIAQKKNEVEWEILTEKGDFLQYMKNKPISRLGNLWVVAKERYNSFWRMDYGVVDSNENIIIPIDKESIIVSPKGYFIVNRNEKEEKVNENGAIIVFNGETKISLPSKYIMGADFEDGVARVKSSSDLWGIIDVHLNEIIPPKYHKITPFKNGFSICNGRIIVNKNGQEIYYSEEPILEIGVYDDFIIFAIMRIYDTSIDYDSVDNTECVQLGAINYRGELVVQPNYERIVPIDETKGTFGLKAGYEIKSRWGGIKEGFFPKYTGGIVVHKSGKIIEPVNPIPNEKVETSLSKEKNEKQEKEKAKISAIKAIYDSVSRVISGFHDFVIVQKNDAISENKTYGVGVYDLHIEKEIVPTKYSSIEIINKKYAYAKVKRKAEKEKGRVDRRWHFASSTVIHINSEIIDLEYEEKGRIDLIDLENGIVEENLIPIEGKQFLLKEVENGSGKRLYGLMDLKMHYLIDPIYAYIYFNADEYIGAYNDNGVAVLIDENGFVYAKYNRAEKVLMEFRNGLLLFEKRNESDIENNGKTTSSHMLGIENLNGDIIFPYLQCDDLHFDWLPNGYVIAKVNGYYHLYDSKGERVTTLSGNNYNIEYKLYPNFIFMQGGWSCNIYDYYGNILKRMENSPDITEIQQTPGEYYMIRYKVVGFDGFENQYEYYWEVINKYGQTVVPYGPYVKYNEQEKEFVRTIDEYKCGYLSQLKMRYSLSGSILVKSGTKDISVSPIYQYVSDFQNGYAMVLKGQYWGMINSRLEEVVPCICTKQISFNDDGIAIITQSPYSPKSYGMLDVNGELLMPFLYNSICKLKKGYYVVNPRYTSYVGLVNNKGEWIIPAIYDEIGYTKWTMRRGFIYECDSMLLVVKENKYGYINYLGDVLIDTKFDRICPFNTGRGETPDWTIARLNGLWGFIDKTGCEVISCKFDSIEPFSHGLAAVKLNGFWGFIDKTGEIVIPCEFDSVSSFAERKIYEDTTSSVVKVKDIVACATWMDEELLINRKGEIIARYDQKPQEEYDDRSYYDDAPSISDNPYYNDNLDMDQQSPEFWNSL